MTIALARRLVWEGVAGPEEVSAALRVHVTRRVAFLEALAERLPDGITRLELELRAPRGAVAIVADAELSRKLPAGLTRALLAVPLGRDPATGAVRVAVADALDTHLVEELAFHLQAPVEPVGVPLGALLAAVRERPPSKSGTRTPAFGTSVAPAPKPGLGATGPRPSDRPIPLVRVSPELPKAPTTVKGVAPPATRSIAPGVPRSPVVVPPRTGAVVIDPVISLTRAKSLAPAPAEPRMNSSPPATQRGPERVSAAPAPARAPGVGVDDAVVEAAVNDLKTAASPEDVVALLIRGLAGVASRSLVLAVRGARAAGLGFEGRDGSDASLRDAVRSLVVPGDRPSVLLTAVQAGTYVGPIPQTPVHAELASVLASTVPGVAPPSDEIAVGVVSISGRPALVYVVAGFQTAYLATRRCDSLAEATGRALERIVRERKK